MPNSNRILPDWIDGFMELTENSEPPILFRKWTAISTIAAALQRKVRVNLGVSLTFFPNLYVVLVGPPATGKGTAMKFASDIMEQVPNIQLSAQATSLQALIRRMKDITFNDLDTSTGKQQYHASLTVFSGEFTVFLGYHNRELISALCDWYDCHNRWSYETISRDREEIIGVWVNMLAGTTPDSLQSSLPVESIGGGLTSRIIFIFEEDKEKLVIFPDKNTDLQEKLARDLEEIVMMSGEMKLSPGWMEYYKAWCEYSDKNPPFFDKKLEAYCGRRRKHLISLSMICCASRTSDLVMTEEDIDRAATFLAEAEVKMGLTFRGIGKSEAAGILNDAITFIETSTANEIPLWQFARYFESNMDKFEMDRVLKTLETMKYIQLVKRPQADAMICILDREEKE